MRGRAANGAHEISYDAHGGYSDIRQPTTSPGCPGRWSSAPTARSDAVLRRDGPGHEPRGDRHRPRSSTSSPWSTCEPAASRATRATTGLVRRDRRARQRDGVHPLDRRLHGLVRGDGAEVVRETSGDRKGLVTERQAPIAGTGGTRVLDSVRGFMSSDASLTVGAARAGDAEASVVASRGSLRTRSPRGPAAPRDDAESYSFHWSGAAAYAARRRSRPRTSAVTATNNGENATHTSVAASPRGRDGRLHEGARREHTYTQFTNGQPVKRIVDASSTTPGEFASGDDPNGDFGITETGTACTGSRRPRLRRAGPPRRRDDAFARLEQTPSGSSASATTSKLADGQRRHADVRRLRAVASPSFYGPIVLHGHEPRRRRRRRARRSRSRSPGSRRLARRPRRRVAADVNAAMTSGTSRGCRRASSTRPGSADGAVAGILRDPPLPARHGGDALRRDAVRLRRRVAADRRVKSPDGTITRTDFD